jgi:uncharacterized protein (TIGR03435 family)
MRIFLAFCLGAGAALAQPGARPEFEVASIKAVAPTADPTMAIGVHVDGAQVHMGRLSLKDYIRAAYDVKIYQISGPEWLGSQRFDIDAKLPAGAPRDQVPAMLQTLLEERFKMKLHRESKEFPVYGLVIAAGGLKLKESPVDAEGEGDPAKDAVQVEGSGGPQGVNLNFGKGSYFRFADSKLEGKKLMMAQFAETLARFVDRPILDMTNLSGRYDIALDLSPEDYRAMLIRSAISAGVSLPPQALQLLDGSDGSLGAALKPLGLKLDPRKAPLEVLVIDRIERTPTEN